MLDGTSPARGAHDAGFGGVEPADLGFEAEEFGVDDEREGDVVV